MTTVTVVPADVRPLQGAVMHRFTAGETLAIGNVVYVSANDTVSKAAGGTFAASKAVGIVVSAADGSTAPVSGTEVDVVILGPVCGFSTTMAYNAAFYVSNTAGGLEDAAGTQDCVVGFGLNGSTIFVKPYLIDLS